VTKNLAMSIAGKTRGAHIKGRHWQRLADACGLNRTMILRRIETLASRARRTLPDAADRARAMPGGDHPMLNEFVTTIDARCRAVIANLAETG
jgi:serine/threonine-protein kinase HipA